ncbi:hypothetical protein VPH35_007657 [Triticum aestivum]|uniref:pentatricopeptide repeat-containing protein At3g22470, mitochondrial n=1 Tax=Triticum aestivum TaxID=4565 RepID=UPI00084555FD|nr:pentatricopeptide repeat-containing protein At3g22470, mitochondrial-like [Triticum aestivum]
MRRLSPLLAVAVAESIDALRFSTCAATAAVPSPPNLDPPRLDPSDIRSHNAALIAYSSRGSEAPRLAHLPASCGAMLKSGFAPDTFTYNCLMLGLCRAGLLTAACGLFVQMPRRWGAYYDRYSYTILIQGLCVVRRIDDACRVFAKMSRGWCRPGVHTYTVLLDGLCKARRVRDAKALLGEMVDKGVVPNVVTYNALIGGLCQEGRFDDVTKLLEKMEMQQRAPDCWTYTIVVMVCGSMEKWSMVPWCCVKPVKGIDLTVNGFGG